MSTLARPRLAAILLGALFLTTTLLAPGPAQASSPIQTGRLVLPDRGPAFLLAVNYEGPADQAWQMWDDSKWDPDTIDEYLRRAREAGFSTVRVFVQPPLVREVLASNWAKLDVFLTLAERQGLSVIISLYDYGERDLAKVADVAGRIASRYVGNPTILAYDIKNEPQFSDLAAAIYPGGARAPIQEGDAAQTLRSYQQMVDRAGAWVVERGYLVTALDYLDSPDGRQWDPLLAKISDSLAMWIQPQLEAIRRADGLRPVTTSYSNLFLAKLPANGALDYVTVHRYPGASGAALAGVARTLNNLRATFPGKPVLLGEFGYSNASMSPDESANYEIGLYLQLVSEGLAGGSKWMLNDFPSGFNPTQNAYGAFQADGTAKPVVPAVRALSDYLTRSPSPGGHLYVVDRPSPGYRWAYEADDALILSASNYRGARVGFQAERLSQLFLTWTDPGTMRIYSTSRTGLELDPSAVVQDPAMGTSFAVAALDGDRRVPAAFTQDGSKLTMSLEGGRWYELTLPHSSGVNPSRPLDYDIPGGRFFTQTNGRPLGASATGFAVTDSDGAQLWSEFQRLGNWPEVGYPITQRFTLDGFVTQAFQKGVLQWRPEVSQAYFLNTFDVMHDRGMDSWLQTYRQTPDPFDTSPDTGLPWEEVVSRHLAFLDQDEAIKARFLSNPSWLDHYGLPVSYADAGNSFVIRAQRATFQHWKEDVPWAAKGEVTVANGGDLAKEAYLWPVQAAIPQAPPSR